MFPPARSFLALAPPCGRRFAMNGGMNTKSEYKAYFAMDSLVRSVVPMMSTFSALKLGVRAPGGGPGPGAHFVLGGGGPRFVAQGPHGTSPAVWMHVRQGGARTRMEQGSVILEVMEARKGGSGPTAHAARLGGRSPDLRPNRGCAMSCSRPSRDSVGHLWQNVGSNA